jgi:phytoene dehydrogenase-like protein
MEKSMIIIGAGVAGLAAGCYAQMNGYQTTILEMADTPGGLCTSWKRKGYTFDGSVAGLAGSAKGSPLFNLWQEIGVIQNCPLFYGENFGFIKLPGGRQITVHTDIHKLEDHLLEAFPHERSAVLAFTNALKSVMGLDIPFTDQTGWAAIKSQWAGLKSSLVHLPALIKYGKMDIGQLAAKAEDPELQTVFHNIVHFGGDDLPLLTVLLPLTYAHRKMAGIPKNGWLSFARAIEKRYLALGGSVMYGTKVATLLIENNQTKGVLTADGGTIQADRGSFHR